MLNRRINSCRASMACSGFMRLRSFSRRSGSIAASSRTNLLRVFHFAYLLKPMPIASSAEMIQTVMSVPVTKRIKKRKPLETTDERWALLCEQSLIHVRKRAG